MGTRCSSIGIKGVVIPSKRIDPNLHSKGERQSSIGSGKFSRGDEKTTDTVRSPENPLGVTIRHRNIHGDLSMENSGKLGTINHSNNFLDSVPNTLQQTDISNAKAFYQYKKGPLIGKGTYGEVYECLNLNTGELLAVKSFKIHGDYGKISSYIETLKKEITLLRSLGHINIVKYYTSDITEVRDGGYAIVDIVLEYVSGGSVRKLLDKFSRLEEKVIGTYIRQVLEGLTYLHLNGIVHRNIKGSNILIDTTGTIKLTDFGCSGRPDRFSEDNPQENSKANALLKGPAFWSAPEVVMRKSQGKPADVWSVGCVVIEMLTGQPPWVDVSKNMDEFMRQISLGTPPPFPKDISENCRDFLYRTFKFRPEDRPSPLELLDHPFVRDEAQDTSYMEAESIQTYQTFQSQNYQGGKVLDLLNTEQKGGERKYMDLKTNNFMRQQVGTGNLSMSNINLGRLTNQELPTNMLDTRNKLKRVTEVNYEDENSPEPHTKGLYKFSGGMRKAVDETNREEEQAKEARRKKLEEEMAKEMMQFSTGQLSETAAREDRTEIEEEERRGSYKRRAPPIPLKNSLFPEEPGRNYGVGNHQENEQSELPTISMQMKGVYVGQMWNSEKIPDQRMYPHEQDGFERNEEFMGNFDTKSTGNLKPKNRPFAEETTANEVEMKKLKEKLRRQYEEQIEESLARVNSEKLTNAMDKDGQSEMSDIGDLQFAKRNFEELHSSQFMKISAEKNMDNSKNEESGYDIERIMGKKFEEDLGNFRGVWDTHVEEIEGSGKRSSSPRTESEGRSPDDKYMSKKTGDSIKLNREDSSSLMERNTDHETSAEFAVVDLESARDRLLPISEEEARKLGIINEAEEIKEDSSDEEGGRFH